MVPCTLKLLAAPNSWLWEIAAFKNVSSLFVGGWVEADPVFFFLPARKPCQLHVPLPLSRLTVQLQYLAPANSPSVAKKTYAALLFLQMSVFVIFRKPCSVAPGHSAKLLKRSNPQSRTLCSIFWMAGVKKCPWPGVTSLIWQRALTLINMFSLLLRWSSSWNHVWASGQL